MLNTAYTIYVCIHRGFKSDSKNKRKIIISNIAYPYIQLLILLYDYIILYMHTLTLT